MPPYSGQTDDDSFADAAMPENSENRDQAEGDDKDSGYPDVLIAKSACPGMEVGSKIPLRVKEVLDDQYLCVYEPEGKGMETEESESPEPDEVAELMS